MLTKIYTYIAIILFTSASVFAVEEFSKVKTVKYVLSKAKDHESVVLEGRFIAQTDDDEFIFQDKTGKVAVEISRQTDIQPAIEKPYELDGAKVKIKAIVDKEMWEKTGLEAIRVKILEKSKDEF